MDERGRFANKLNETHPQEGALTISSTIALQLASPGLAISREHQYAICGFFCLNRVRESLEALIGFAGWKPECFASAEEFLAHPRQCCPSCLILDVSLPALNGLDLQQLIATDRPDMPIIFVTGHGDIPMSVQAMKAGAVEFLTKPIDDESLTKRYPACD